MSVSEAGFVDILVFNVSHLDMILGIRKKESAYDHMGKEFQVINRHPEETFGRPRFNMYHPISNLVKGKLEEQNERLMLLKCPFDVNQHEGGADSEHIASKAHLDEVEILVPVGYSFETSPIVDDSWKSMHFRVTENDFVPTESDSPCIVSVLLPLLSQVLATWMEMLEDTELQGSENVPADQVSKKVVFLISGAGKPRNRTLDIRSNSTKGAAEIMQFFINREYPNVTTKCLDSGLGVFHYDQNVKFCNELLLPAVEELRRPLVTKYGYEWKKRLNMTIALTDGSPARLAALNASLRTYKPNYLHMWQLKTFWYEYKFFRDDLLFESFETMETKPPVPIEDLDQNCKLLVEEMRKHKDQFVEGRNSGDVGDLASFWLRKTRKVVLSVLMVQASPDEPPKFFRGMNLEVSMPTGSLCAERNVIGTALATNPTLRRQDLRMIAVLSLTLETNPSQHEVSLISPRKFIRTSSTHTTDGKKKRPRSQSSTASVSSAGGVGKYAGELNPIQPCGACNEWLKKIAEVNPTFKVVTFPNSDCEEAFIQEVSS